MQITRFDCLSLSISVDEACAVPYLLDMLPISQSLKRLLRYHLAPIAFRYPRLGLAVPRFYQYLQAIERTNELRGAVVEVGAAYLGTTALASRFLREISEPDAPRPYVAIDTFSGFVEEQFIHDRDLGTRPALRHAFSSNSMKIARRLRSQYGADDVSLVQGDIATLPDLALPETVSVALIDVDLDAPVYAALHRLWERLEPGGMLLVDDCQPNGAYPGAYAAYRRFAQEKGLVPHIVRGAGIVER